MRDKHDTLGKHGMDTAVGESMRTGYMYEQDAVDRQRLQLVSGFLNTLTAEACLRAGVHPGTRAIDVGCGQLGALPVLAGMVGPSGLSPAASRQTVAQAVTY